MERTDLEPAPVLGDATDRVLTSVLGYDAEAADDLKARKVAY